MNAGHVLTVAHFPTWPDESRLVLRCTAGPDAMCHRRPVDGDAESWDEEAETTPGHECWAVEWVAEGGIESLIYRGSRKDEFDYAGPVDVWFDGDGVAWCEHVDQAPLFAADEVQP